MNETERLCRIIRETSPEIDADTRRNIAEAILEAGYTNHQTELARIDRMEGKIFTGDAEARLSPKQLTLAQCLLSSQTATQDACRRALWGNRPPCDAANTLKTHISQLRLALKPLGLHIVCRWNAGYSLIRQTSAA